MSDLPDRESTMRERVRDLLLGWDRPDLAMYVNDKLKSRDEMDPHAVNDYLQRVGAEFTIPGILDAAFGVDNE
jgi:hypothetical protein